MKQIKYNKIIIYFKSINIPNSLVPNKILKTWQIIPAQSNWLLTTKKIRPKTEPFYLQRRDPITRIDAPSGNPGRYHLSLGIETRALWNPSMRSGKATQLRLRGELTWSLSNFIFYAHSTVKLKGKQLIKSASFQMLPVNVQQGIRDNMEQNVSIA